MVKLHLHRFIKLFMLFLVVSNLNSNAQNATKGEVSVPVYSEQFRHDAQELVDWNKLRNEFSMALNVDLSEATGFFRYAFDKGFINYNDYLKKVKEGLLTKENALQYWTDQIPYFGTLYKRELKVITQLQKQVRPYTPVKPFGVQSCNNLDFGDGTTANWVGAWNDRGRFVNTVGNLVYAYSATPAQLPVKTLNSNGFNTYGYVHQLVTDDAPDIYTGIKKVPPGHKYALRLGDDKGIYLDGLLKPYPFNHQVISNTFTVGKTNPCITYSYAVVFSQDKGNAHIKTQQPFFKIRVYDENMNEIKCGTYDVDATKGVADGFKVKDIKQSGLNGVQEVVYKDWTPIYIPLIDYIGKKVTVQFETSDCWVGGHMGYVYLGVDCSPFELITLSPSSCDILEIELGAPAGAATYFWSGPGIKTDPKQQKITVDKSGKYSLLMSVTANDGVKCEFTLDTTIIISNGNPVANFDGSTVCLGQSSVFTDQSTPKGVISSWSWDFNNDGVEDSNVQNPSYTFNAYGTYPVKLRIKQGTCQGEVIKNVTVGPAPILSITNPPAVCAPFNVDITAAAIIAGSKNVEALTYWKDAGATIALLNASAISTSGTFYIKSGTGSCADIKPVTVTINELPISTAGVDVTFCTGESAVIGSGPQPNYTYLWTPSTGLNSNKVSNPTVSMVTNGSDAITTIYIVETTNSATGCKSTDSVMVLVTSITTANAGPSQSVCIGTPIILNGSIGGAATSAKWSGGSGTYSDITDLHATYTPSNADVDAGSVTLTLTTNDPAGACTFASSEVVMSLHKNPVIKFLVDNPKGCATHCVKFTDSTIVQADKISIWRWDFGDKTDIGDVQNPAHCYVNPGFYDVTLTATSSHGCMSSLTKPKMIEVFGKPTAAFTPTPNILPIINPEVALLNQSSLDVVYWQYNFGDGAMVEPITQNPKHMYSKEKARDYIATLIVKNGGGCSDTVSHEIKVIPDFAFYISNAFTPNNDGVNDYFKGQGVGIEKYNFWIFDRWGTLIFHTEDLTEGWNGKVKNGQEIAQQDVYVWKVKIIDIFNKTHDYLGKVTLVK
ncbi:MAG: PKD domain-containing protein [Bacteroidia bacterium]